MVKVALGSACAGVILVPQYSDVLGTTDIRVALAFLSGETP